MLIPDELPGRLIACTQTIVLLRSVGIGVALCRMLLNHIVLQGMRQVVRIAAGNVLLSKNESEHLVVT